MYIAHGLQACKYTLRKIGGFLEAPKSNMMIQEHLVEEGNLICTDFIIDFVKVMVSMFNLFKEKQQLLCNFTSGR